jgi:hypothetical protein
MSSEPLGITASPRYVYIKVHRNYQGETRRRDWGNAIFKNLPFEVVKKGPRRITLDINAVQVDGFEHLIDITSVVVNSFCVVDARVWVIRESILGDVDINRTVSFAQPVEYFPEAPRYLQSDADIA